MAMQKKAGVVMGEILATTNLTFQKGCTAAVTHNKWSVPGPKYCPCIFEWDSTFLVLFNTSKAIRMKFMEDYIMFDGA